MKSNIIGYKQIDKDVFFLDAPSTPGCIVIRIYGEEKNLFDLHKKIKHSEIFTEQTLKTLNLKFREVF